MEDLRFFYMQGCPYCASAKKALAEFLEDPRYRDLVIEAVDEDARPDLTRGYDYYYVPTFYSGKDKLYEAHPGDSPAVVRAHVQAALDTALERRTK